MTPIEWDMTHARLVCSKCGLEILDSRQGSWPMHETFAEYNLKNALKHQCGMRPITTEEAAAAMKIFRQLHPGLTFEEECKVYNEIMQNQTYL